jgi:hypothetical protein
MTIMFYSSYDVQVKLIILLFMKYYPTSLTACLQTVPLALSTFHIVRPWLGFLLPTRRRQATCQMALLSVPGERRGPVKESIFATDSVYPL